MNTVIIGMGSNIDPERNTQAALKKIQATFQVLKKTPFMQTAPINCDGGDFLNGACLIQTPLSQHQFKATLLKLEIKLGQKACFKSDARHIDLDILVWNHHVVDSDVKDRVFLQQLIQELSKEGPHQTFEKPPL